ncbi:RNA polymerase sigma factor [Halobacteriovorax vibrionivorans]|uniref:RNA polymerase sigma factor n=2 Tax=Halobacteriovoraceae TaxID=1652132 RepID=A0ABY0IEM9_9BACT|nr:RNA polymerase sigma factor [Halobacteriovorax vibrionivorans]TGD46398.1 RNA polymerase sigma factor [Halobacteriovorax sp. Y22]
MRMMKTIFGANSKLTRASDKELMLLVTKDNNHHAFRKLYERLSEKLYRFIYYIVLDESVAQEITHEAFLTLYDKRKMYRSDYQVSTWLWTIGRNKAYDYKKKKKEISIDDEIIISLPNDDISTLQKLAQEASSETIKEALKLLPDSQRDAILLWMDDYNTKEMAEIMEKSEQAIKNLINRAKMKLKEVLEGRMESI